MSTITLCLSAVGRERHVISIAQDASIHDLYEMARHAFASSAVHVVELKHGFPPRVMLQDSTVTLETLNVVDKDRIQVVLVEQPTNTTTTDKTTSSSSSSSAPKRPQRTAAKAATDAFGDVIRAQDALLNEQSGSQKRKRNTTTSSSSSKPNLTSYNNNRPRQPTIAGHGRRLADGVVVGRAPSPPPPRKKTRNKNVMKSTEDVSVALMGALNGNTGGGGGGGGKVGQVLRGAMRNAISNSYEASRAVVKVSCLASQNYTIVENEEKNGGTAALTVEYSKGLEGRGTFTEVVDSIPRNALEAVVAAIYTCDQELLKATTLAQLSPRVFWSLFHIFPSTLSVQDALQSLLPDLDWTLLETRKRGLSAKAKENKRQQQQEEEEQGESGTTIIEAAQEVVNAVQDAMEQQLSSAYSASSQQRQRRECAARAAMARHDDDTTTTTTNPVIWHLVTPTEHDDDELLQCIQINETTTTTQVVVEHVLSMLHSMNIHNWRQLANANISDIAEKLKVVVPETSTVESWVDFAQEQSVEEVMMIICDSRADVVEILRDECRTGTPKDLANWRSISEMLYETAAPFIRDKKVDLDDIRKWCQRAQDVLDEWEWMHWYATPVE
jgi:hypothetical protein